MHTTASGRRRGRQLRLRQMRQRHQQERRKKGAAQMLPLLPS
jgi:hypothetical protein